MAPIITSVLQIIAVQYADDTSEDTCDFYRELPYSLVKSQVDLPRKYKSMITTLCNFSHFK